jgi:hypothetical protein
MNLEPLVSDLLKAEISEKQALRGRPATSQPFRAVQRDRRDFGGTLGRNAMEFRGRILSTSNTLGTPRGLPKGLGRLFTTTRLECPCHQPLALPNQEQTLERIARWDCLSGQKPQHGASRNLRRTRGGPHETGHEGFDERLRALETRR